MDEVSTTLLMFIAEQVDSTPRVPSTAGRTSSSREAPRRTYGEAVCNTALQPVNASVNAPGASKSTPGMMVSALSACGNLRR